MRIPQHWRVAILAAVLTGAAVLLGLAGWPQADRTAEFSGLIVAAILISAFGVRSSIGDDRGLMPPSFLVDFSALLLLGGNAALCVAAAGIALRSLADVERERSRRTLLVNAATILIATEAASVAHASLGAAIEALTW